jgi:hypothetical protein
MHFLYAERSGELPADPLKATRKRGRTSSSNVAKRRYERLSTLVPIVDLMFPSLIPSRQTAETDKGKAERAERAVKRNAASQRVKNWRANEKPWCALVKRFGLGILLLLPSDLLDQK